MKNLFITLTLALLPALVWAQDVSHDEAMQIAAHFFSQQSQSTDPATAYSRRAVKTDAMSVAYTSLREGSKAALYVINRGDNGGFVVVSGRSDTSYPVLGWSNHGSFDYSKAPIQLRDMLEAYSQASEQSVTVAAPAVEGLIELADGSMAKKVTVSENQVLRQIVLPPSTKRAAQRRVETVPNVVVAPLVNVRWDQVGEYAKYIDPYYDTFAGVAAGCVPTAMAQIMAFWKYPAHGLGFHLHNVFDVPESIDPVKLLEDKKYDELKQIVLQYSRPYFVKFSESVYKWDQMGGDHPSTDAEIDNVAKVIFDCHVACDPSRMPNRRGTGCTPGSAPNAMVRYFGYSPDIQYIKCKGNEDLLRQELDAGRPIYMCGSPSEGYSNEPHAFVCDGYAEDGYFHFNFGWSGSGDGYYLLEKVNPVGSDFSISQEAYIGIQPSLFAVEEGHAFINVTPEGMGVVVGGYGDVTVPATVEKDGKSYPVMKVGAGAFNLPLNTWNTYFEESTNEHLTRLTLPESVTEIGAGACASSYLTEVNLPSSIRMIGAQAFSYSSELEKVSIPSIESWLNIDFEPYPLRDDFDQYSSNPLWSTDNTHKCRLYIGDKEATDIVIPSSVKEVKPFTFCGYQFLNSVTIEEGVEKIGTSAFERVPIKQFNIPSTVKEIGAMAFYNHQTPTITIGPNLTKVGSEALFGNKMSEWIVDEKNPKYSAYQGILYDKSRRTLIHCPNYRPGYKEDKVRTAVGVPSTVTTIRAHSFGDNLTKLTLPPSVKYIEDEAFVNTYNLKDLYVYTQQPIPVTTQTFHLNYGRMKVHVPAGAGDAYRSASVWKDMTIVEDQAEGSTPPEHYDYTTDYNAIRFYKMVDQGGWSVAEYHYILFDDHPKLTYSGTKLLITSDKSNFVFEKDEYVDNYYFFTFAHYDDPTAIDDVQADERQVVIRTVGDQLVIRGLEAGTRVMLYSVDGRQLASAKASAQGYVSITIPAADIVVVKAGNNSFKIHTKK